MTEEKFRELCQEKDYGDVKVKEFEPHLYDPAHTHERSIMGLVIKGEMTLEWEEGATTYGVGDMCAFEAGTVHAEKTGESGATIILGFK
ncbi:MAG: hypothetical protein BMS9Abin37_2975 [Acidobacteriota bacterium]|nr:MAG: hypothetical protein BMS9Abin37_2975 [Acidobacteriota bacterium]